MATSVALRTSDRGTGALQRARGAADAVLVSPDRPAARTVAPDVDTMLATVRDSATSTAGSATARWLPVPGAATGAWCLHLRTRQIVWDAGSAQLYGMRPDETPRDTWLRVIHPADRGRVGEAFERSGDRVVTFRVRRDDGSDAYLLSRITHVLSGDAAGWIAGVTVDVTASRESALRAEVVLETTPDVFFCLDGDCRFTYANRPAADGVGRTPQELIGTSLWEVLPHLAATPARGAYEHTLATGEPSTFVDEHPSGAVYEITVKAVDGGLHVLGRDVSDRRAADAQQERLVRELAHQASHDALTGLANRAELLAALSDHLARRDPATTATVLFLDLDRFKLVNDTLGHSTGDQLLRVVADRLALLAGRAHRDRVVARIGGDEFVVALMDAPEALAEQVAGEVLRSLAAPVRLGGQDLHVSASIGLARGGRGASAETLLRDADLALYRAKEGGRDQAAWYDEHLHADVVRRVGTERDLRAALETAGGSGGQLALHYQPSYSLSTGLPTGVEGLLRWTHPVRGAVPPAEAIPVAEDSGLILPLGDWVVATAVEQAAAWSAVPDLTTWVNVSPRQVVAGDLAAALARELERTGVPAARFGIEVTESVLVERSRAAQVLEEVRALGVRIGIDDFGTGFSSLARLLAFPVDLVKVDRSFVAASGTPAGAAVLDGIVTLAHGMGAAVIAEGVETPEQLALLRASACDAASGYLLARPAPASATPLGRTRMGAPGPAVRGERSRPAPLLPMSGS